jgi:hypothetical protein
MTIPTPIADFLDSRAADRLGKALAALTLLLTLFLLAERRSLSQCLASYANRDATATLGRSRAADRDRAAEDTMWQAFADSADPAKVPPEQAQEHAKKAFETFLAARAEANRQRKENPPPDPPSKVCG